MIRIGRTISNTPCPGYLSASLPPITNANTIVLNLDLRVTILSTKVAQLKLNRSSKLG